MARVENRGCGQEGELSIQDATPEAVALVLAADETSNDGRSQWVWVRLPSGDLVLGVYPQGDTYFATEDNRSV